MGKSAVNKSESINISESARVAEKTFSQQTPGAAIGPTLQRANPAGDNVTIDDSSAGGKLLTVHKWKAMTAGDAGLKSALYDFINTTKEGVKVTPDLIHGREKKIVFNFYGTMGKSIMPGEIGQFEVVLSYPPTVGTAGQSTSTSNTPVQA